MKPEVVKAEKSMLKLKFEELDQGTLNLVREELWNDKATEMAGFQVTHPQVGHTVFTLKTKGKDAKTVWNGAVDRMSKQVDELAAAVKKL